MTTTTTQDLVHRRSLAERLRAELLSRTSGSRAAYERARRVMPRGVPSSFQVGDPYPIYMSHGRGARIWDVDGNEYADFHLGFGVMCVGHAHPDVVAAVTERAARGSHFAAPTEESVAVAEELRRRFALPYWRFTNSGTESTLDAVHLARAATGRDVILKMEGSYHGHHDTASVTVRPPLEALGERGAAPSIPYGAGHPAAMTELTKAIPFNDADLLERVLAEAGDRVAGLVVEPAMLNIAIIPPERGYLDRVRELTRRHGVVLIFDEVKTGCTIAPGGAVERFGVLPDVVCLAKAICGGYPGGAVGMTGELAALIESGTVRQVGTFNGNPLVMAAARATLCDVLTDDAYARLEALQDRLTARIDQTIVRHGLPCYTESLGPKGCVVFAPEPLRDYRDYAARIDSELADVAWLHHMAGGVYMTPGADEQWTLSIAHTEDDVDRCADAFASFAEAVASL